MSEVALPAEADAPAPKDLGPPTVATTPLMQAAVLMLALGEESASKVLRCLDSQGVHKLGRAMTRAEGIKRADVAHVVEQFITELGDEAGVAMDSRGYLKKLLIEAIGEEQASEVLEKIFGESTNGLDKLKWLDARTIAEFLTKEHPQIQAIILSHLEPMHAANVLHFLPNDDSRAEIIMRVAQLDSLSPNAMRELNEIVEAELVGLTSQKYMTFGGHKVAAEILNGLDTRIEEQVMGNIRERNEVLGQQIEDLMFVFADLATVEDRDTQTLLREISSDTLKLALKGAEEPVKQKLLGNLSKRAAELLLDDLEAMGPVRLSDVEAAQKEIIAVARRLADSGDILLSTGNSDEMI